MALPIHLQFKRGGLDRSAASVDAIVQEAVLHGYTEDAARDLAKDSLAKVSSDVIWLSPVYQVNISENSRSLSLSIKRLNKAPLFNRDHLVDLADHFCRDRKVTPVELYPTEQRVVDTANQYHVWFVPVRRAQAVSAVLAAMAAPEDVIPNGDDAVVFLPMGSERDWRAVQRRKDELFGPSREAVDLLLPETRGHGVVLYAPPPGAMIPCGYREGLRSDIRQSPLNAVQRPFG